MRLPAMTVPQPIMPDTERVTIFVSRKYVNNIDTNVIYVDKTAPKVRK